jgi:5-methylthioadenosine/S-adenosylhomocysteine deaminase
VEPIDWLVEGTVITMDPDRRIVRDGAVAVSDGRIVAVDKADTLRERYSAERTLGGPRRFVIPGLIDCHNHVAQALVREYALEDFPNIYRVYIPAEDVLGDEGIRTCTRVAAAQLLRAGVTTLTETTCTRAHEDPIAETIDDIGMRSVIAVGQGDRTSRLAGNYEQIEGRSEYRDDPGLRADSLAGTEDFIRRWSDRGAGRIRPWIHNLGVPSCSDDMYMEAMALAEKYDTGVMTHINRDREEIELSFSLFGERPLEHLHTIGALGPRLVAIHAMLTTDREIRLLADAGVGIAHAPVVCTDIVSAVTKIVTMRAFGVRVGLGCDTVINDILKVMRVAFIMQTQATGIPLYDPIAFTTEDAFAMGTIDAARLLRWQAEIGSLEAGKAADVTVIDGDNVRLFPSYNPIGTLVRYAVGTDVESVMVAGRLVVDDGTLLTIDEAELLDEAGELATRLGKELEPRRYRRLVSGTLV